MLLFVTFRQRQLRFDAFFIFRRHHRLVLRRRGRRRRQIVRVVIEQLLPYRIVQLRVLFRRVALVLVAIVLVEVGLERAYLAQIEANRQAEQSLRRLVSLVPAMLLMLLLLLPTTTALIHTARAPTRAKTLYPIGVVAVYVVKIWLHVVAERRVDAQRARLVLVLAAAAAAATAVVDRCSKSLSERAACS